MTLFELQMINLASSVFRSNMNTNYFFLKARKLLMFEGNKHYSRGWLFGIPDNKIANIVFP